MIKVFTFLFLFAFGLANLKAQFQLKSYTEIGNTNISEGVFINTSEIFAFGFKNTKLESGIENKLTGANAKVLNGLRLAFEHGFNFKNKPYAINTYFIYRNFSEYIYESNYGLMISKHQNRLNLNLGLNFKTIGLKNKNLYSNNADLSVNEIFNPVYSISYVINKNTENWNLGVSVCNYNNFMVNQATNPMSNIFVNYKLNKKINVFAELWYLTSGAFNLHVNYYGIFFRPGLIWKI